MSIFVTNMASMLGIGVAVDYSLFILARYREELARGPLAATRRARSRCARPGMAVAFSGVTVIVALAGLFLIDAKVVRSMAVGAIVVVAIAVLAAVTLLPALIARARPPRDRAGQDHRPPAAASASPSPARASGSAGRDADEAPAAVRARRHRADAADRRAGAVAEGGHGGDRDVPGGLRDPRRLRPRVAGARRRARLGPVQVLADFGRAAVDQAAVDALHRDACAALPGVEAVAGPVPSRDGRKVLLIVITPTAQRPRARPRSRWSTACARPPARPGATVSVGGATAQNEDDTAVISGSLWKVGLFVDRAVSYIVLLLRPAQRAAAAEGRADERAVGRRGLRRARDRLPVGLVRRLPRLPVARLRPGDHARAAARDRLRPLAWTTRSSCSRASRSATRPPATTGGRSPRAWPASAKTISSAALIMVAVFAIFAGTGIPQIKEIGVGLAVAIALDATVVRLVLVPTTMELMGDANWWLPKWLDRITARHGLRVVGPAAAARHDHPRNAWRPYDVQGRAHHRAVRPASGGRPPSGSRRTAGPSTRPPGARPRSRTSRPTAARRWRSTSPTRSRWWPPCATVEDARGRDRRARQQRRHPGDRGDRDRADGPRPRAVRDQRLRPGAAGPARAAGHARARAAAGSSPSAR